MEREELIKAIDAFAEVSGWSPATICGRAVGNTRLYKRLAGGGECVPSTAKRLYAYIATETEARFSAQAGEAA